jgi:hypothetical protein
MSQVIKKAKEEAVDVADDGDEEIKFEDLSINQLRKYASLYRIALDRDSTKDDILRILKAKAAKQDIVQLPDLNSAMPRPGYSRINLARDPMPGAGNYPVYMNVNGYEITIPRGVTVDVPNKVVTTLNDAVEERLIANHDVAFNDPNHYTFQKVLRYPFQLMAQSPGPDPKPGYEVQRAIQNRPRQKFRELFKYWPSNKQLLEAQRDGFLKLNKAQLLTVDSESLVSLSHDED